MGKTEEHRNTRLRNLFLKRKSIKTCCFNDASLERKSIMSIPWMNIFLSSKYTQKVGRDAPSVPTWRHPLDRKKQWNRLLLGAPPLGGGWEGFPDEGVCPYFVASLWIEKTFKQVTVRYSSPWGRLGEVSIQERLSPFGGTR